MSRYLHLVASEVLNKPLLVQQSFAESFFAFLGDRIGLDTREMSGDGFKAGSPSFSAATGVAFVPVMGSLTHRASWLEAECGMRSYESIGRELDAAADNPDIQVIAMEVDSPGGTVAGAFDLADKVKAISERKPVLVYVNDLAASAAYLLASQGTKIFGSQTAMVGSIGVVMAHVDRSKQLEMDGIKPTFLYRGARKIDGNSALPLSDEARDSFQKGIDEAYDMFVSAVVRGRDMTAEQVRETEAGVFGMREAMQIGMADAIMSKDEFLQHAINEAAAIRQGGPRVAETTYTQAQYDEGVKQATAAERSRISAIIESDLFAGREATAKFAIAQGMSVEQTNAILATVAATKPADNQSSGKQGNATANKAMELLAGEHANEVPADLSAATQPDPAKAATDAARQAARQFNSARFGKV